MYRARRLIRRLLPLCVALVLSAAPDTARAAELNPDLVKNEDARAFPRGLYFHSSIPVERRQMLVEDLAWLAGAGPLEDSDALADLLAIKRRPLSGAMLVAWLIERVVIVSALPATLARHQGRPVILSGARPDLGVLVFHAGKQDTEKQVAEINANKDESDDPGIMGQAFPLRHSPLRPDHNWRSADIAHEELDGWRIDDRILIATEDAYANPASNYAAIYLTELFWRKYRTQMPRHRIMRLALLFHEARHLDGRHPGDIDGHFPCEETAWPRATEGFHLGQKYQQGIGCNWHHASAFGLAAAFIRTMSRNCPACTSFDLEDLKLREARQWEPVQFRLRTPARIPHLPALRGEPGWADLTITTVPPQIFFTALTEWIDLRDYRANELSDRYVEDPATPSPQRAKWHQQVAALSDWIAGLDRQGFIDPEHSPSRWGKVANDDPSKERRERPDPDERNAVRWVMAASKAKAEGFNLPLAWMPPCRKFRDGCGADADAAPPQPAPLPQPVPGWLGVTIATITSRPPNLNGPHGVRIVKVDKDSPAGKAGLLAGDIILEADGQPVANAASLTRMVAEAGAGATLELAYATLDEKGFRDVTLTKRPAEPAADASAPAKAPADANPGAMPASGDPAEQRSYRIKPDVSSGYLNMRSGPGQQHQVVARIPAGSDGVALGACRPPDDGKSRYDWCNVTWRGHSGWVSRNGVVEESTSSPRPAASGWERYSNTRFQYQVDIPPGFAELKESDNGDGVSSSSDGGAELRIWGGHLSEDSFAAEIAWRIDQDREDGWNVTYQKQQEKWAVWSGAKDARIFYTRAIPACDNAAAYFRIEYDKSRIKAFDPIISRLAKSLQSGDC